MELLVSLCLGVMMACGVYLALRGRTFPVVVGLTLIGYTVNMFLFVSGRLHTNLPAVISPERLNYADPLPQALVLTAIVIGFGMIAFVVVLALRAKGELGSDHVDGEKEEVR
ncbi:Na+/H+ antiporter subunit C [Desulfurispira natronophila]|uniref:Multicomponent K+:H+ antiporter subunit C n=1 Tax=Desulfurispira natronophila TaxID=682562 RepID=A0A7W8DG74_9BACT|nr:Na+/H+ antiporter subunit C [Desulfurispira natronophila]MBB5021196.1 multicomponent K+:H+ antiporter subunit C [Desulfurispira natronophila]